MKTGMKRTFMYIMLITVCLLITGCKDDKTKGNQNNQQNNNLNAGQVSEIDSDTRIAKTTSSATTELKEKTLTITDVESGEISIMLDTVSGSIDAEVIDGMGMIISRVNGNEGTEKETSIVNIDEGNGTYTIRVNLENFVGTYDISWAKSNIEQISKFTSDKGYELEYDSLKFVTKQENGADYFISKSSEEGEELDENVYLAIRVVSPSELNGLKETVLKEDEDTRSGDCILAKGTLKGSYFEKEKQTEDGEKLKNMVFAVELENKNIMVIDSCFYEDYTGRNYVSKRIDNMLNTIVIK